jgi:predicted dehydrogenase
MNKFRWGILSTAGIARKNWRAIRDSGNSVVTAVASRDAARSRQFIEECQREAPAGTTPAVLGNYEALLASKDVDAVYIPLPTGLRKEWVLRAAAAGKHVLAEKPCGLSLADVREMTDACKKNSVQYMDGVMFMHNPRLQRMREILDDGTSLGPLRRITSVFTFGTEESFFDANIRVNAALEPTGCLGDVGWYCLRIALWAVNWQLPTEVTGKILTARGNRVSDGSAPTDFSGELIFGDGPSLGFSSSFRAQYQNWVHFGGAKGWMRVPDFVHALSAHEPSFELNGKIESVKACHCAGPHTESKAPAADSRMFHNFSRQAASGKLNEDWPMWSLKTQQVLDACFESGRQGSRPISLA